MTDETWFSVDVETSGPTPSTGSLIAIGACVVEAPGRAFYAELRPLAGMPWKMDAQRVHGLTRRHLEEAGQEPGEAVVRFVEWVEAEAAGRRAVFVGFNATFDWMWVADAAWRYAGRNPFGSSGVDLKALYLGRHLGEIARWSDTSLRHVLARYPSAEPHTHNALDDARVQAAVCRSLLATAALEAPGG